MDMHRLLILIVSAFGAVWFANVFRLGRGRKLLYATAEGFWLAIVLRAFYAATIGATIAICIDERALSWAVLPLPDSLRAAGAFIAIAGEALFVWVVLALGRNYSTTLVIQKDHTLVVRGPYKYVRHPMYTSFLLYFLGVSLLSANAFVAVMGALALVATMIVRTPKEEAMMIERFGDQYREYMKRTSRHIPL